MHSPCVLPLARAGKRRWQTLQNVGPLMKKIHFFVPLLAVTEYSYKRLTGERRVRVTRERSQFAVLCSGDNSNICPPCAGRPADSPRAASSRTPRRSGRAPPARTFRISPYLSAPRAVRSFATCSCQPSHALSVAQTESDIRAQLLENCRLPIVRPSVAAARLGLSPPTRSDACPSTTGAPSLWTTFACNSISGLNSSSG